MPAKTRSHARHSEQSLESDPAPSSVSRSRQRTSSRNHRHADNTDSDNATGSEFVPEEKTTSPDSDDEFPSSLPIPPAVGEMDVDEDSTPPRNPRPSASSSSRGKVSPTKSSKPGCRAQSPEATASSRPPTPDNSIVLDLQERPLPDWAIPAHVPDFVIRSDPLSHRPPRYLPYEPVSDVDIMETFKDPCLVKSRLEDSLPEVFDNPAHHISATGKWLQKLAEGDCSVARFPAALPPPELPADQNDPFYEYTEPRPKRKQFVATPLRLPEAGNESLTFAEYQAVSDRNTKLRAQHNAKEMARFRQLEAENIAALKTWESRATEYRRNLPIVRARQVESIASYQADRKRIIDRIKRQANTIGEYAYFLARRALPRSGSGRGVSSRVAAASGEPVPLIAVPSKRGHAEIDDTELPPIAALSEGDADSGEDRPLEVTRVGPPGKGKMKATSSTSDREFREGSVTNASRIAPGAALSAKPEPSSAGSFLGAGSSAAERSTADGSSSFAGGEPSSSQQETPKFDVDAWHEAHNPFTQRLFQQDLVLNANGTKAVVSHGWELDPVNPRFLARLAPYGVLASQMPSWAVTSRAKGCKECHDNGAACVRLVLSGAPLVTSCQRCRMKNRTCVVWASGFDFTLTDHVISTMNAELVDMYIDAILSSLTPLTGVDVAARVMSRVILFRQDARLREGRAPHADPAAVGAPLERRVDVLVRPGARREQFLERSFVPFRGAQYGDRTHQLPLPVVQDPTDAATYMTHILEDIIEPFLPDRRVELPEGFEAGDRPLDLAGFVASGDARPPPLHPPILPSESELSHFLSTYHFGGEARACLEEKYPGGLAYRHADGRVTGPLVAGGFNASEGDSTRGDDSAGEDDSACEKAPWPVHPAARSARGHGSLSPIDEELRDMTPPSSAAFTAVPSTPSNFSHTSFASVGSVGTFGDPRGSILVGSSIGRLSALDMTPLTPLVVQRVDTRGISLPPRIVIHTHIAQASRSDRAASVDAGNEGSFGELDTGNANNANGASGGSRESGGADAGSSAGAGVEDVDME
ncbi:hypothetical protein B0H14DRAFT_2606130 [Mycena olivaceomarginata]|nr:hypothetical protein B0H14DRAFT_2606130 [Mycena olivaceomarginata]